jgi:Flp pilus assembly protein TadD
MAIHRLVRLALTLVLFLALPAAVLAGDLRLKLPKRSKATPVQQLNRDGVKAIEKHQYDRARKLFYRAYLLDPNDPFTLNNLGYISELQGDIDRAQRYYDLAQQQESDAVVAESNDPDLKGKPVSQVAGNADDATLQINRMNMVAIGLLQKDRAPEADLLLQKALALDGRNPFTLNNLGYAKEKEGELEAALRYYNAAAGARSQEPVIVAVNRDWRGKAISEVAGNNAQKLQKELQKTQTLAARVARLNLEGVSAMNRNDHRAARNYFEQAYQLDPNDAFTLTNMGYLAEMDGDRETADFYYDRAREAKRNRAQVTVATRREAEGRRVGDFAAATGKQVEARMEAAVEQKRREAGPIALRNRDNSIVVEPDSGAETPNSAAPEATPPVQQPGAPLGTEPPPAANAPR